MVGPQHALWVRRAIAGELVHHVAAVGQPAGAIDVGAARLRVLPGDPPDLHHGHRRAVGQHDGHLQQHPDLAGDVGLRARRERLRAIAALEQEGLTASDRGQPIAELIDFARHDQRRLPGQGQRDFPHHDLVRPRRLLCHRKGPPRVEPVEVRGRRIDAIGHGHWHSLVVRLRYAAVDVVIRMDASQAEEEAIAVAMDDDDNEARRHPGATGAARSYRRRTTGGQLIGPEHQAARTVDRAEMRRQSDAFGRAATRTVGEAPP